MLLLICRHMYSIDKTPTFLPSLAYCTCIFFLLIAHELPVCVMFFSFWFINFSMKPIFSIRRSET